jgi:hypothetical protein
MIFLVRHFCLRTPCLAGPCLDRNRSRVLTFPLGTLPACEFPASYHHIQLEVVGLFFLHRAESDNLAFGHRSGPARAPRDQRGKSQQEYSSQEQHVHRSKRDMLWTDGANRFRHRSPLNLAPESFQIDTIHCFPSPLSGPRSTTK